ncbi:phosphotransferase [Micromonospora siamensis]|uniref:Phosphotransferase enzyme family protein n=1 Tax=Micromonospora siamensis TaxID=299152 RepID=A0A1C5JIW8_9ACTN|nr:phosphotransferase [Micromonospora siamensis]SCG70428.1 Phosphotransferase enzyme family protein [Micromonospora siamensis]
MTGQEELLPGGFVTEVVRIGDTVRRTRPANADFVEALLRHLERAAPGLAPRHLGYDERGRQVLSHVDGRVPWREREDPGYRGDAALTRLAALIRRLHDACAGTELAGAAQTVCHLDLSPKNTVYRDSPEGPLPVALLDWDLAAPGRRIDDVAFAAWHFAELGDGADPGELGRRARLLCAGYDAAASATGTGATGRGAARDDTAGGGRLDRAELVDVMLHQIEYTWRGIDAGADLDRPGMRRLRDAGAVDGVRAWQHWLVAHRDAVTAALLG